VTLACSPPLLRLFRSLKVNLASNAARPPKTSLCVMAMSLPGLLGATLETLPQPPYLRAPQGPKRGGVGFVWKGNRSTRTRPLGRCRHQTCSTP
jgi:hypothetical protein